MNTRLIYRMFVRSGKKLT